MWASGRSHLGRGFRVRHELQCVDSRVSEQVHSPFEEQVVAIARNAPCPCGSGKKYKLCCLDADAEKAQQRVAQAAAVAASRQQDEEDDVALALLSNEAVDLVHAGEFAKAEAVIAQLRERFPYAHDWMERTAFLNEKRGQFDVAREYYGKCLELALTQPELFDDGTRAFFRRKIAQFSSASATPD